MSLPPVNISDPAVIALLESAEINLVILSQINLPGTIGVGFLGSVVSGMLYGVTCVQTFNYFRNRGGKSDTLPIQLFVLLLLVLDSLHQILIIHILWHYLIDNYANPPGLLLDIWSVPTEIIVNAVIAFLVETFLCFRLWRLSQNKFVVGVCFFWTCAHLTMNLLFPIRSFFFPGIEDAEVKLKSTGSTGLAVAVVTDVLIAAAMVFYLHRSRTGFRRSDDIITKLIALTVTSGGITTIFVICNLISYLAAPKLLVVLFFNFQLAKLYINSLLTSLNARDYVRSAGGPPNSGHGTSDTGLNTFQNSYPLAERMTASGQGISVIGQKPMPVNIQVGRVVETDSSTKWTETGTAGSIDTFAPSKSYEYDPKN